MNMKQTKHLRAIASVLLAAFVAAGCNNTPAEPSANDDTLAPMTEIEEAQEPLVSWQTVIDEYLTKEIGQRLGLDNTLIVPCYTVLAVDSSDANDYRVWGDWRVVAYSDYKETLITSMETFAPGLFHLKKTSGGFEVVKFDEVEEGRAIDENAQRVFDQYNEAFWKVYENQEYNDSLRLATMAEYVRKNNLPYTKLQLNSSDLAREL